HPNVAACQKYYIPAVVEGLTAAANGDDPEPTDTPTPQETEQPTELVSEYDNAAGHWKFDFGAETENGYYGVGHDRSYTDSLDYGFVGIKEDDYKLSAGQYMDSFRTVKGQSITLANGTRTGDTPDNDFVALTDEQYPLRFAMAAENGGYYNVKVRLVNASDSETATVSLFAEKRHQLLTNKEIPAGEYIDYEFNADVETYYWKALNGQFKDDTLSIELVGKNAAISTIEVTKLEDKGTTLWVLGDSTGCDQPSNYPYYILNPYAGVGQALSKYLPKTIAVSNQGDGGIASGDANHYSVIKSQIKQGDYLYVEFGHNESSTAKYKENLETYYSDCHAKGAKLIIVGPIDRCQDKQFDASTGKWSSTLNGYSDTGKAFVQEKIAAGATDIAFVDLNASWIEFLNATTANVKEMRSADVYEKDSVYYYYKYKASGIDVSHINDAGADNAAYIFFTNAKAAVTAGASAAEGSYEKVNADVLSGLVTGMREETPFAINEEIVTAGKVPNSLYPTIPTESYDGYEAEITNAEFNDSGLLTSVTAKVEHYDGFEKKGIPYAVAIAEIYNADNTLKGTYQSTAATKYDATNGNGTFTLKFDNAEAILPEGGTYKIWLQGFTSDNTVMEGTDNQVSDYFTPASLSEVYLIGDKEDIKTPDTFLYYGMKEGAELNANNGWYLVGSSTKSAKLQSETASGEKIGYAELKKDSTSGSWYLYRAFDNKYTSGKITLETDLYYESGYMKFLLSNKTSEPNNTNASKGINQRIDAFYIGNDGKIYDGNNNALAAFPKNEWVHISYEADMDNGIQTLKVGDETYTYSISGLDTIIPSEVTVTGLQQLNISGSSSYKMSARIRNTSAKHIVNSSLETRTLTVQSADNSQGTVSIADSEALTKTAQINSLITVSAEAKSGYRFSGWYEGDTLISETAETQIRLHRDVTLTAKFISLSEITITAASANAEQGTATVNGNETASVTEGSEVTFKAVSADGYKFANWTNANGDVISAKAKYKMTVSVETTLTANFAALANGEKVWDFAPVTSLVTNSTETAQATYNGLEIHLAKGGDSVTDDGIYWAGPGSTKSDTTLVSNNRYIKYTADEAGTLNINFSSTYMAGTNSNNNPRLYIVTSEANMSKKAGDTENTNGTGKSYTLTKSNSDETISISTAKDTTYYIFPYCYNKSNAPFNITNITFTA
ncbi:MAG: hypothetical protein IJI39_02395, partial [Clostridia bacterium]|nr:hypothetical protein [Clostridia bacterium]